jgi:3-hydroxybutyryl-CoA dehydrogenase
MAESGQATVADIDTSMRLGAGYPQGPFEILGRSLSAPAGVASRGTSLEWRSVGIAGAGHMASGIAEAVISAGQRVTVLARGQVSADRLVATITARLDRGVDRGRITAGERGTALELLVTTTDAAALGDVDVIIEAVREDLSVKRTVLARLDSELPSGIAFATNTSSYTVAEVMRDVARDRATLALHFFNPAERMRLVEVVPGPMCTAEVARTARAWVTAIGKQAVDCADTRGFIVNRLLIPYLNDAVRVHEDGVPIAEIESAMTTLGHPMGPLALIDLIGVDVTVAALEALAEAAGADEPRIRPATTLRRMVDDGHLGRKSGTGFHSYLEAP